jgi:hypothetical protein
MKDPNGPHEDPTNDDIGVPQARETGRASVRLDLANGRLFVLHGETGRRLMTIEAKQGAWSAIWRTIIEQAIDVKA